MSPIGAGGFSWVYRAETRAGSAVAIKLSRFLHDPHLDRERAVLEHLDGWPGPRVVDAGRALDRPYLVLEWLDAPVLATPDRAVDPSPLIENVARAVDALHDRGVLHRDLKPANILADASGATLIDFGLARGLGAGGPFAEEPAELTELTRTGQRKGTWRYMAPELCRGREPSRASDLYALAIALYEITIGRPPFRGDVVAVQQAHLWRRPPSSGRFVLDEVFQTALAKAPGARFSTARELATAITDALHGRSVSRPVAAPQSEPEKAPPANASNAIGRRDELAAVEAAIGRVAHDRTPTLLVLEAEAGVGSTRFAAELVERVAGSMRHRWLAPRAEDVARALLGHQREVSVELAWRERTGAAPSPAVSAALELALGVPTANPSPMARSPRAYRRTLAWALAQLLESEVPGNSAMLVVLDDAERADPIVLDALEIATMGARSIGALAIFDRAIGAPEGFGSRARRLESIELGPLSERDGAALVRSQLEAAGHLTDELISRVVALGDGRARQLVAIIEAIVVVGGLRERVGTRVVDVDIDAVSRAVELLESGGSELALRVAEQWTSRLAAPLLTVAQVASALREPLDRDLVIDVVERLAPRDPSFEIDASAALAELHAKGLLLAEARGSRFANHLLRAGIASSSDHGLKIAVNEAAAAVLGQRPSEVDDIAIAEHYAAADRPAEAARYFLSAAEAARNTHRLREAVRCLGQALLGLDADSDAAERMHALAARAELLYRLDRVPEALTDVRAAKSLAVERADPAMELACLLDEARFLDMVSDRGKEALPIVERAIELSRELPDIGLAHKCALAAGRSAFRRGETEASVRWLRQCVQEASRVGDAETEAIALLLLGPASLFEGDADAARAAFDDCLAVCERAGDRFHRCVAHLNRVYMGITSDDPEAALADGEACIALARELGQATLEMDGCYNHALVSLWCGQLDAGVAAARRAAELMQATRSTIPRIVALAARAAIEANDLEAATEALASMPDANAEVSAATRLLAAAAELWRAEAAGEQEDFAASWSALFEASLDELADHERDEGVDALLLGARLAAERGDKQLARSLLANAEAQRGGTRMWSERMQSVRDRIAVT